MKKTKYSKDPIAKFVIGLADVITEYLETPTAFSSESGTMVDDIELAIIALWDETVYEHLIDEFEWFKMNRYNDLDNLLTVYAYTLQHYEELTDEFGLDPEEIDL